MIDSPQEPGRADSEIIQALLETEDYVPVSPEIMADPFYRIAYLVKQEIRKFKWIEAEKGNSLSWEEARKAWSEKYYSSYEQFLKDTLRI